MPPRDDGPAVELTSSPNRITSPTNEQKGFVVIPESQHYKGNQHLNPYTRPLTVSDIESVVALENASFPDPQDRATREKVCSVFKA